jgi:hypothetical protein
MNSIILQFAGNLVVAGVGAWIGSRIGLRHALEKLRKERAFERRLAWYEDTIIALTTARDKCVLYALATRQHDSAQLTKLAPDMDTAFQAFGGHASKAVLYTPKRTVEKIESLGLEIFKVMHELAEALQRGQLYEEYAAHLEAFVGILNQLLFELAQEVRTELGIEKLELSDLQRQAPDKG